jgi:hypothetical protein
MTADRGVPGRILVVVRQIRAERALARMREALRDAHGFKSGGSSKRRPVPDRAVGSGLEFGVPHDAHDEDSSLFAVVGKAG